MLGKLVILLASAAVLVSAKSLYLPQLGQIEQTIPGLERYLVAELRNDHNLDTNLGLVRDAMDERPELGPVGEALLAVASAHECSAQTRQALRVFISLKLGGPSRIEELLSHFAKRIPTAECLEQLADEFNAAMRGASQSTVSLLERFEEETERALANPATLHGYLSSASPTGGLSAQQVRELSAADGDSAQVQQLCRDYVQRTEHIFEGFFAVAKFASLSPIGQAHGAQFASMHLSDGAQAGLMAYKRCRLVLGN